MDIIMVYDKYIRSQCQKGCQVKVMMDESPRMTVRSGHNQSPRKREIVSARLQTEGDREDIKMGHSE